MNASLTPTGALLSGAGPLLAEGGMLPSVTDTLLHMLHPNPCCPCTVPRRMRQMRVGMNSGSPGVCGRQAVSAVPRIMRSLLHLHGGGILHSVAAQETADGGPKEGRPGQALRQRGGHRRRGLCAGGDARRARGLGRAAPVQRRVRCAMAETQQALGHVAPSILSATALSPRICSSRSGHAATS